MAKFLLIDDDSITHKLVKACLSQHDLVYAKTLSEARELLPGQEWDLVLLDVMLPDGDGMSFLMEAQSLMVNVQTPIILLTGRTGSADKVAGYTLGAEDYITKPIDPIVFKAVIEAKIRRKQSQQNIFKKDGFVFSLEKQTVVYETEKGSKSLDLTSLEFKLFLYLAQRKEHVLSREKLMTDVWGDNLNVTDRTVDSHISHLRKRLIGSNLMIQSVYGAGYKLTTATIKAA